MAHSSHRRKRRLTEQALADYRRDVDEIASAVFVSEGPKTLYHYTDWNGFRGIVSDQHVRAFAHDCMADQRELTSVDHIVVAVAKELLATRPIRVRPPVRAFLERFDDRKIARAARVYIACFSSAHDTRSQWADFGRHGTGVCLAFEVIDGEVLTANTSALLPVVYDESTWRSRLVERFGRLLDRYARLEREYQGAEAGADNVLRGLFQIAAFASISAKTPSHVNETEWRSVLIQWEVDDAHPRKYLDNGREYVELRLRDKPHLFRLQEVLLGPRQDGTEVDPEGAVRAILESAGYGEPGGEPIPPIRVSRVDLGD